MTAPFALAPTTLSTADDRFRWIGEASNDAGVSWQKRAEFFGRRVSFAPLR